MSEVFTETQVNQQTQTTQPIQGMSEAQIQSFIAKGIEEGLKKVQTLKVEEQPIDEVERIRMANQNLKKAETAEKDYEIAIDQALNETADILSFFSHSPFEDNLKEVAKGATKALQRRELLKRAATEEMILELRQSNKAIETSLQRQMEAFMEVSPQERTKMIENQSFFDTVKGVYSAIMNNSVKTPEEAKRQAFDTKTPQGLLKSKLTKGLKVEIV